ncbi:MAG: glycosyltransferase family 2 protein [bacterium]|nr:glycosyltransferase family 2 protein [bacterium]
MNVLIAISIIILGFWGVNFTIWGTVGLIRLISNKLFNQYVHVEPQDIITPADVAIIVPAHNEELVIENTIKGIINLVPRENIHIVTSDFERKDRTADIARAFGVTVVELPPPLAKASKLQNTVNKLIDSKKFKAVLLVDADTILAPDYLEKALPHFRDRDVVAVAGHASTLWEPEKNNWFNQFILSYRERVYYFGQLFIKFGQSWKYTNVCPIVPGFASVYRLSVLPYINIDPGGLVIEDFNMTFEVHHNNLGRIVYSPEVKAYTQDPDNLKDYFKQIKRWNLGFWQTVFRHGFWNSFFWYALIFFIFEVCFSTVTFLLLPFTIVLIFLNFGLNLPYEYELLVKGVLVADYILTIIIAVMQGRPRYLIFGLGFIFMRFVDSIAYLYSIPKAVFARSSGAWVSPTRR